MTTQISDTLIYNGESHSLYVELLFHHLRQRDIKPKSDGSFSALWRGYVAIFEIREFELYLKDFILAPEEKEDFIKQVFPDGDKKLTFINRLIVLYRNKLEAEWSVQEYNTFETYEILEIKNGILTDFKILSHSEMLLFKEMQYERYIVSEDYIIAKQKRIRQLELENESLRKLKNKGPQWSKYRFKEGEFKEEIMERVLYHTFKFY